MFPIVIGLRTGPGSTESPMAQVISLERVIGDKSLTRFLTMIG